MLLGEIRTPAERVRQSLPQSSIGALTLRNVFQDVKNTRAPTSAQLLSGGQQGRCKCYGHFVLGTIGICLFSDCRKARAPAARGMSH